MNKKQISEKLYESSKATWLSNVKEPITGFSNLRYIKPSHNIVIGICSDGIGTKVELAERMDKYDTIAYDLIAMVCDDAVCKGGIPIAISSVLDINNGCRLSESKLNELVTGYVNASKTANVSILNGETAELGNRVSSNYDIYSLLNNKLTDSKKKDMFRFNWSATVLWFAKENKLLTGLNIKPGDSLVGFKEYGFRSNGYSTLNDILEKEYGHSWHTQKFGDESLGKILLAPSIIYTRAITDLLGGLSDSKNDNILGVAHITGGGIPEKLGRLLKSTGLSYNITDPIESPLIFSHIAKLGKLNYDQASSIWNMGTGMIVVTRNEEEVISTAKKYNIDSKVIGYITK